MREARKDYCQGTCTFSVNTLAALGPLLLMTLLLAASIHGDLIMNCQVVRCHIHDL